MTNALITLTTDFGPGSSYVAAMKGVLYRRNRSADLVDLSHAIPPQDLRYAAFFLRAALPYFPPDALHVVVVDPGVGTERALLAVAWPQGRLLAPDNGCWTTLCDDWGPPTTVVRLQNAQYWRHQVSNTFHGRDILASVAGHWSLGVPMEQFGVAVTTWQRLDWPTPQHSEQHLLGEIVFIDNYGNCLTNIPATWYEPWAALGACVRVGRHEITRHVRTYGLAPLLEPIALVSSMGTLEIAINGGNAAQHLALAVGQPVQVVASQGKTVSHA